MTIVLVVQVALSLAGIASGFLVVFGRLSARRLDAWTAIFFATSVLTSATGYAFPFRQLLPSHIVGALSLIVLAVGAFARYGRQMAGHWRRTYVVSAVVALYFKSSSSSYRPS